MAIGSTWERPMKNLDGSARYRTASRPYLFGNLGGTAGETFTSRPFNGMRGFIFFPASIILGGCLYVDFD